MATKKLDEILDAAGKVLDELLKNPGDLHKGKLWDSRAALNATINKYREAQNGRPRPFHPGPRHPG